MTRSCRCRRRRRGVAAALQSLCEDDGATGGIAMKSREFELETTMSLDELRRYLDEALECLRLGYLQLRHEGEELTLTPAVTVTVALKAKQKSGKESLRLKIAWRREEAADGADVEAASGAPAGSDAEDDDGVAPAGPTLQITSPRPEGTGAETRE